MEEKLKQIRLSLKKTQKEMSAFLGLGEITWQNYERGVSKPKLETLEKLNKLGFNINWITSDGNSMMKESVNEVSISLSNHFSINKLNVFNTLLNEMKLLYQNADLSKMPQNYIENKTFEMTLNIVSMAQDNNEAVKMIQLLINQEKENIEKYS